MAQTVEEIARDVVASINSSAGYLLASKWVANRYKELCTQTNFRHLRQLGELIVPQVLSAGTVTVSQGSNLVTGDSTAIASWTVPPNSDPSALLTGRFLRVFRNWYEIAGWDGTSKIILKSIYTETSGTAVAYKIVQRKLPLDPEVRHIADPMVHTRFFRPIYSMSQEELNAYAPERLLVGPPPDRWSEIGSGVNINNKPCKVVEVYPYPTGPEQIAYVYWQIPFDLTDESTLPAEIDGYVLKEGALIDAMRYEMAALQKAGKVQEASLMRNDYRAQATIWERYKRQAVATDRGVDDLTFIMMSLRGYQYTGDIATARDEVFSRGARP